MTKRLVYSRPDGSHAFVHINPDEQRVNETQEAFIARMAIAHVPKDATGISVVNADDVGPITLQSTAPQIAQQAAPAGQQPLQITANIVMPGAEKQAESYLWERNPNKVEPEPAPQPDIPVPPAMDSQQQTYSLQDLLARASDGEEPINIPPMEPPSSPVMREPLPPVPVEDALADASRRRAAKASVRKAVADVNRVTNDQHFKYELALLVKNQNVDAMNDMKMMAAIDGITVQEKADQIVAEHTARRRRASQIYAVEAQAMKDIDNARGDDIDAVARDAVIEIMGDQE